MLAPSHYQTIPKTKEQMHKETYRRKGEPYSHNSGMVVHTCHASTWAKPEDCVVKTCLGYVATRPPHTHTGTQRQTGTETEAEHAFRRNRIPDGIQTVTAESGCIKKCTGCLLQQHM